MAPGDEQVVPQWAADLRVSVAKIEGRTEQIPDLVRRMEELRANTVPLNEHTQLMERVDQLWSRDLGARSDWEEVTQRVPMLWEERGQRQAIHRTYRLWLSGLSILVTALTAFVLLRDLGFSINLNR